MQAVGFGCSPLAVVPELWRMYRGRPCKHPDIVTRLCKTMHIESLDGQPLNYMIDGDFHRGGQSLEVRVGQRVELLTL